MNARDAVWDHTVRGLSDRADLVEVPSLGWSSVGVHETHVIKQPDSKSFAFCDRCGRWTRCPAKLRKLKEECPGSVESGAKKDNWAVHCLRLLRAGVAPGPGAKLPAEARLKRGRPKRG